MYKTKQEQIDHFREKHLEEARALVNRFHQRVKRAGMDWDYLQHTLCVDVFDQVVHGEDL